MSQRTIDVTLSQYGFLGRRPWSPSHRSLTGMISAESWGLLAKVIGVISGARDQAEEEKQAKTQLPEKSHVLGG